MKWFLLLLLAAVAPAQSYALVLPSLQKRPTPTQQLLTELFRHQSVGPTWCEISGCAPMFATANTTCGDNWSIDYDPVYPNGEQGECECNGTHCYNPLQMEQCSIHFDLYIATLSNQWLCTAPGGTYFFGPLGIFHAEVDMDVVCGGTIEKEYWVFNNASCAGDATCRVSLTLTCDSCAGFSCSEN